MEASMGPARNPPPRLDLPPAGYTGPIPVPSGSGAILSQQTAQLQQSLRESGARMAADAALRHQDLAMAAVLAEQAQQARLQDTMNWHMQAAQQRGRDQIAMQQMLAGQMALNAQANQALQAQLATQRQQSAQRVQAVQMQLATEKQQAGQREQNIQSQLAAVRAQLEKAEQEKHGIWWNFCHKLGLIQTDADRIQNARGFLAANTAVAYVDGNWVKPQDMTDEQALRWWMEYTQQNKLLVAAGSRGFASMGASKLTNAQAGDLAKYLGFSRIKDPPFDSHGQAVFESHGRYITHDVDGHKKGAVWKEFDRKGNRIGTLDALLNRIAD
jgi:hypothetical protein